MIEDTTGKRKHIYCKDLKVGDIAIIKQEETFPADLVMLASSREQGECFIATGSLDGEKNLKKRN